MMRRGSIRAMRPLKTAAARELIFTNTTLFIAGEKI